MKKAIAIFSLALAATLFTGCNTECETMTTRNITVLVVATDSLLIKRAKHELRKENYNPTSTALSHTNWGQARNKLVVGWRDFYAAHEQNLKSLDSVGIMESTSLFPTLMKAINKTDGTIIIVSDLIENNPVVNFYKNPPTTPEQMEKAYQALVGYYLPDGVGQKSKREVVFIVMSEPKNSGVVHKARAFWKYALEENLGLSVSFADGISTL